MKLTGSVKYQKTYLYTIYLSPKEDREEIVRIFGNRWQNGKRCLGVDEEATKNEIDNTSGSVYIVVHEKNTEDYATASMNVEDLCFKKNYAQAWIWQLCRHGEKTSVISPVKVLFEIVGQFVLQKFKNRYLYLNPQPGEGIEKLKGIYQKYGFTETYCPEYDLYTMRKKISLNKRLVSFSKVKTKKRRLD